MAMNGRSLGGGVDGHRESPGWTDATHRDPGAERADRPKAPDPPGTNDLLGAPRRVSALACVEPGHSDRRRPRRSAAAESSSRNPGAARPMRARARWARSNP